jgi:hypothetical protein
MRTIGIVFCVGLAVLLASASYSRGDDGDPPPSEPTETMPAPGSETPPKSPFVPYSAGPPEAIWTVDDLTPAERVVAERGLDSNYASVNEGYKSAVQLRSAKARADAATRKLGIDGGLETGVVP